MESKHANQEICMLAKTLWSKAQAYNLALQLASKKDILKMSSMVCPKEPIL